MIEEDIQEQETDVDPDTLTLTNWKNEPTVRDLKTDLDAATVDHNANVQRVNGYLDLLHVRGTAKPKTVKGRSSVQPKLVRKQAEWRFASLSEPFLSAENIFDVEPVTYEDREAARQNALVLNHQFNHRMNKVKFINDYVRAAVTEGTIICRVGWKYKEITVKEDVPVYDMVEDPSEEGMMYIEQLIEEYESDPITFDNHAEEHLKEALKLTMELGVPVVPQDTGKTEESSRTKVVANHGTVEVCDYRNVLIDPTCKGDISKANFIIYDFETSLSELKKDGIYKNLDNINIGNESVLARADSYVVDEHASQMNFSDKLRKKIVAYEYWGHWDIHKTGEMVPIVATFVGNTMIRMEENPFPDKDKPFVVVPYLPRSGSVHGDADAELIEDNQRIVGAVTRGMVDIMARSASGQQGTRKDALDVINRTRFANGDDYDFNPGVHPEEAFYMHKYPEIPQSAQYMLQLQNSDADALTGIKGFSGGISGEALGNTATGVRSALDATAKRDLDILRRLSQGIVEIGRKFISMNAVFLEDEEIIRITNEEFISIDRDDLEGNFDLKLSVSTAETDNQKAEELAFMLQTMGNNLDFNLTKMILVDIARLRKMPSLAKNLENYSPEPDPIEEERRMLEIELLKAQIQATLGHAAQRGSDAQLSQVKAGTESVKAQNLQSQTSRNVLDFVEQESGVKQERDLQRQQAQAKSLAELEIVKDMLERRRQNQTPSV